MTEKMTAEFCLLRAGEARAMAAETGDMPTRLTLLRIAEGYDTLAHKAALRTYQQSRALENSTN
jgi:hypothetical protein